MCIFLQIDLFSDHDGQCLLTARVTWFLFSLFFSFNSSCSLLVIQGNDMCFGQQVSNEVFQLVQDEMRVLSTSVEENKDSWVQDHEGLRNNLDSLRERFASSLSKLEEKHVALESDLISVKEDQLKTKETVASLSRGIDKLSKSGNYE